MVRLLRRMEKDQEVCCSIDAPLLILEIEHPFNFLIERV